MATSGKSSGTQTFCPTTTEPLVNLGHMTVVLNGAGEGETWTAGGAEFRVLHDGGAVDRRWGMLQCTLSPGFTGPPQHIHREHDEAFYVVSGSVKLFQGG